MMTKWKLPVQEVDANEMFVADMPIGTVFKATSGFSGDGGAPLMRIWHDEDVMRSHVVALNGTGNTWTEHGKEKRQRGVPYAEIEIRVAK